LGQRWQLVGDSFRQADGQCDTTNNDYHYNDYCTTHDDYHYNDYHNPDTHLDNYNNYDDTATI